MRLSLALCASCWLLACTPAAQTPQNSCLAYGRGAVTLAGKAVARMVSIDDRAPQNMLLLQLDAPICIDASGAIDEQQHVREIQLVPQSSFKAAYSLAGLHVTATGPLSPATGGQHPGVIMTLQAIGPG